MIYITTIIGSLILSFMMLASEAMGGNITHLKNGREPNAGACLFPTVPCVSLFFCGIAWLLDSYLKEYSIVLILVALAVLYTLWAISYKKLKSEFETLTTKQTTANKAG